jgi:ribosomal protein S7
MATYIATAPDGKEYEIDAPEGATQEQALDYFKSNWKPQEQIQAPEEKTTLQRFADIPANAVQSLVGAAKYSGNLPAGMAQGVSNIGVNAAELVNAIPPEKAAEYKSAVQQKAQEYGADPQSAAFKTGEFAGETLPLMGLGGAAGAGARMAKLPENVAAAAESFGLSTGPSKTYLKDYVAKVGAGALMNTAGGQLLDPNSSAMGNAGFGALAGATSGVLAPVARGVAMLGKPLYESGKQAILDAKILESLRGAKPLEAVEKLRGGMTPEQLAVDIQSPDLAANIQSSEINKATAPEWSAKRRAEEEALASRVNQAQSSLNALHQGELPVSNVSAAAPYQNVQSGLAAQSKTLEDTKATRTAELLRQAETEQAGLNEAKQQVASTVAQPEQREIGQTVIARKRELQDQAAKLVSPLYKQSFELAPQPFSIKPLIDKATELSENISTAINKESAPFTHTALKVFKQQADEGPVLLGANGKPLKPSSEGLPPTATLESLKALRSEILTDLRELEGVPESGLKIRNLKILKQGIDDSIAQNAPTEARAVFDEANKLFRSTVAEPYMEGTVDKLTRQTNTYRPQINPSEVADKFLHPDHAADFIRAFGNDPEALQAIATGVEGKFNAEVVQGGKSADKFLRDNREALKTLDSTGAGIQNRLSEIVRNFEPIEANQAALGEQVKAIPKVVGESVANQQRIISKSAKDLSGATDPENLAKVAVSGDARLMGRILHKLTPEAKPELANQVINNAFEPITAGAENAGAKTAKALDNSRIATLLKATYGKEEGAAKLADFKETANIQSMLEKVKKEAPNHPYDTAQALDNLTEGKPALKRTVEKIMSVLNDQEQFEALAMTGRRIGENTKKMASEATPHTPYQLTTEGATLRWIHGLVTKQADKAIAEKLSRELMSSEAFANAIERAQSRLPYDERNLRIGAGGLAGQSLSALQSRTSYSGEK